MTLATCVNEDQTELKTLDPSILRIPPAKVLGLNGLPSRQPS